MSATTSGQPQIGSEPSRPAWGRSVGLGTWWLAIRPKTLAAAAAPVVAGSALAFHDRRGNAGAALAALLGALWIQIGTNLVNDYYDFKKGADTPARVGPVRVTQGGLVAPSTVLWAAGFAFGLAALSGVYLLIVAGWPVIAIGLASILCGYAYTGGPFPLGYHGLGDLFVMVFFGFVAVLGTYFVQAHQLSAACWVAAIPMGALSTAILAVNNLRDAETDAKAGKRTLVVRLGARAGKAEYCAMLLAAAATPWCLQEIGISNWGVWLPLLSAPLAIAPLRRVLRQSGAALNPALGETARVLIAYAALFAIGLQVS